METRRIGSLEVGVVGLGCNNFGWRLDEARARTVIDAALDHGITLFDTADIYGGTQSEAFIGRALEGRRDRVVLATKFGMERGPDIPGGADSAYVRRSVEGSLRRLRTDRIDLYQLHEPDERTPIAETLAVLDELITEGMVREIGCSNFTAAQLREADVAVAEGAARFVSVQNELSLLERDDMTEALPEAERLGLAYIPYFPLGRGLLTGKYRRGQQPEPDTRLAVWYDDAERAALLTPAMFDRLDELAALAVERGHTLLDLAFGWLLSQRQVASVIAGATRPEQIEANVAAGTWRLTDEDLAAIALV